jgi:nitrate reductase gamma subunit
MVERLIDLSMGPLFRVSLAILVLGLLYRLVVIGAQIVRAWSRANNKNVPWATSAAWTARWAFPLRLFTSRPVFSAISVLFHVGIILAPIFLAGHVALLSPWLPAWWPTLGATLADGLTLLAIVTTGALIVARLATKRSRELSTISDVLLLVVIFLLFGFGYLAAHPQTSPWDARTMLLVHALLGNAALILTPTTKIAHCVLFPFSQLVFDLAWHYPARTGERVAVALGKENEPV